MDKTENYVIEVSYHLYVDNEDSNPSLVEKTSDDHPFQFISGLGFALEPFEKLIVSLQAGENFNFTIPSADAYGEYMEEHVLELDKNIFNFNGHFDEVHIYPGAVVPMTNDDGNHFEGIVKEIREKTLIMDFNHPLAGKDLTFKGKIISKRLATEEEIQKKLQYTHTCGCGHCHDGESHGEGCNCEGHHHGEGHCDCDKQH